MNFSTKAIHVGQAPDPETGAVIVPIYQTSTYEQESPGEKPEEELPVNAGIDLRHGVHDRTHPPSEARELRIGYGSGAARPVRAAMLHRCWLRFVDGARAH